MAQNLDRAAPHMALNHVHIIGAGMAGLSAAVTLAEAGIVSTLYEAGPAAGGRCRSYHDRALDLRIDNGNHLLLSGNDAVMAYLDTIGARHTLTGPGRALFPFMDIGTGERWDVAPGPGRIPWWILFNRVPGTRLRDYLALDRLRNAPTDATVEQILGGTELYRKLLEPLAISGLNTMPHEALASLLWAVVDGSLMRGGRACMPLWPHEGLSESLVDPALVYLASKGCELRTGARVAAMEIAGNRIKALTLPWGRLKISPDDAVILAVPPWVADGLMPGLDTPQDFEAIANVHFRVGPADQTPALNAAGFIGLIGGTAEWVFAKPGILSVTISAANRYANTPNDALAERCWADICAVLGDNAPIPPHRALREKRATFAATAVSEARRPSASVGFAHFAVAGDWTSTLLPSTIEGAVRSGRTAAHSLLSNS
jgi:squalene-associated FAD-dependent desaturase